LASRLTGEAGVPDGISCRVMYGRREGKLEDPFLYLQGEYRKASEFRCGHDGGQVLGSATRSTSRKCYSLAQSSYEGSVQVGYVR
jgi:hypothetical protein